VISIQFYVYLVVFGKKVKARDGLFFILSIRLLCIHQSETDLLKSKHRTLLKLKSLKEIRMKTFTKTALTLLAASVMTTAAFAETGTERVQSAKGGVEALGITLENMGASVDTSVNLNGAYTFDQKEAIYSAKHAELQNKFDVLHAQSAV
jgi:hypothetical protein